MSLSTVPPQLAFRVQDYAGGTRHPRHLHDELHFSLVLRGRVVEQVGTQSEYARPLSVVVKDSGVSHANEFGAHGARLAQLSLPWGTVDRLLDDRRRAVGWRWTHDPTVARPFLHLVRRAAGRAVDFSADDPDIIDLLAAFTARQSSARGEPPAWLSQVMQELRESWCPALTVSAVARRAGVHPVYLARCVRRWFGTGLAEELRRLRLLAAAERIAGSCLTISDVAHDGGYADEPHLNRDFRREVGLPPGRFRDLVSRLQ